MTQKVLPRLKLEKCLEARPRVVMWQPLASTATQTRWRLDSGFSLSLDLRQIRRQHQQRRHGDRRHRNPVATYREANYAISAKLVSFVQKEELRVWL